MTADVASGPHAFWPGGGGRFDGLMARLHLVTGRGLLRWWWLVAIAWLPLVTAAALRVLAGRPPHAISYDISVHVRLVIALPLMLRGDAVTARECRRAVAALYDGGFADRAAVERIVDRAERLRSSRWVELGLAALALAGGQLALWSVVGEAGAFHGFRPPPDLSFSRVWYALVGLPLFQFVMFRWLWRWGVWTYLLARVARLPLALIATHPDRAGGLDPLAWPVIGFDAFVFATGAVASSAWASLLIAHRVTLPQLLPGMLAFLVLAVVLALGPLLLFCGHLFRARQRTLAAYGQFALDYVQQFDAKWIERPFEPGEELGAQDIQALNDLGGAFGVIDTSRLLVFSLRRVAGVALAAVLPMLPLLANTLTVEKVLQRLLGVLLGGIPA